MSSGLYPVDNDVDAYVSGSPLGYFGGVSSALGALDRGIVRNQGTTFDYENYDSLLGVHALKTVLADEQQYLEFPRRALFDQIGMRNTIPGVDRFGDYVLSSQVYTNARDLARLGLLYLNGGKWNNTRILPESWVRFARTPAPATRDLGRVYGGHFWLVPDELTDLPQDAYSTAGSRGQYTIIVPSYDLIIVRRGEDWLSSERLRQLGTPARSSESVSESGRRREVAMKIFHRVFPFVAWIFVCGPFTPAAALAQLSSPNAAGVAMGHLHYHVRNVEANRQFWITLGGQPVEIAGTEAIRFPGVLIFLNAGESTGGSEGAVLNHVAFRVRSLAQVEAAGLKVEPTAGYPGVASTYTPEDERIELFEDAALNLTFTQDAGYNDAEAQRHNRPVGTPIAFHHIHMYVPEAQVPEVKAWYVRLFGGIPGKRSQYDAVDLPGMNLNLSGPPRGSAPTKGRMLDHIGLEITGLEAFCARLVSMGVKLDTPYNRTSAGFASAVLTDPWGTTIELTEGLRKY